MRWTGLVVGSLALLAAAQGNGELPEARKEGGMALVEALAKRRSVREYRADRPLTRAELGLPEDHDPLYVIPVGVPA